ncbi:MAG: hypothetical protein LBO79_09110 [Zoogloeaceae bacterium]|nr:hypothetical protein [Zoogloeaceae bacterium]
MACEKQGRETRATLWIVDARDVKNADAVKGKDYRAREWIGHPAPHCDKCPEGATRRCGHDEDTDREVAPLALQGNLGRAGFMR